MDTSIAYGFLDYTSAIINSSFSKEYLTRKEEEIIAKRLRKLSSCFYPFKNGNMFLYHILNLLAYSFKPLYKSWGDREPHIGSRKRSFFWF